MLSASTTRKLRRDARNRPASRALRARRAPVYRRSTTAGREAHRGVPGGRPPGQYSEPGPPGPASAGVSAKYHRGARSAFGGFRGVAPPGQYSEPGPPGPASAGCYRRLPQRVTARRSLPAQRARPPGRVSGRCVGEVPPRGRGAHAGGSGGSPPGASTAHAGGSGGSPPGGQHSAFGGFRGVAPRANTALRSGRRAGRRDPRARRTAAPGPPEPRAATRRPTRASSGPDARSATPLRRATRPA